MREGEGGGKERETERRGRREGEGGGKEREREGWEKRGRERKTCFSKHVMCISL